MSYPQASGSGQGHPSSSRRETDDQHPPPPSQSTAGYSPLNARDYLHSGLTPQGYPLPSPDYSSFLAQTPGGATTPGGLLASGMTAARQEWNDGRLGGWNPDMFRSPVSGDAYQMPRFLQPTSLGDIRRTSLVEETAANQRAIDEWNAASYEAGASGMTIEPGEGISGWSGWGDPLVPFGEPSSSSRSALTESQQSFQAGAEFLQATYPSSSRYQQPIQSGLLTDSPVDLRVSSFHPQARSASRSEPSDPTPPSGTSGSTPNPSSNNAPSRPSGDPSTTSASLPPAGPSLPSVGSKPMPGLYSSTGFDILGILTRVLAQPNARNLLGPVDFSCSFIVVDVTKDDNPIAFASPTFSILTGYDNKDIVGRNCRFLQAPDGKVERGSRRKYTDNVAVSHLHNRFKSNKECQASLINYKRGGTPFVNLVTIIPITWDSDDVAFLVGFQVDLVEAPNAILASMQDGTYQVNYQLFNNVSRPLPPPDQDGTAKLGERRRKRELTDEMRALVEACGRDCVEGVMRKLDEGEVDRSDRVVMGEWYRTLTDHTDDFIHVVSLKGYIQYVSPFVRNVLGYDPEDLHGMTLSDIVHPADIALVQRELKEATQPDLFGQPTTRTVNFLCRMERKVGGHVWVESTGRLYAEPGKGKRVVVLAGRARTMPRLEWSAVESAGGVAEGGRGEGWGMVSKEGLILYASPELREILGARGSDSLLGDSYLDHIPEDLDPPAEAPRANATTMSPSKLRASESPSQKIKNGLNLTARGLPKSSSVSVRHQVILPRKGSHRSNSSMSIAPPHSSGSPLLVIHEVSTTFYAAHPEPAWPDPTSIANGSGQWTLSRNGTPETESFPIEEQAGPSRRRPVPSPIVFQVKVLHSPSSMATGQTTESSTTALVPGPSRPVYPSAANVFEEVDVHRGTSWLYELQRLKNSNRKMRKEIATLRSAGAGSRAGVSQREEAGKRKRPSEVQIIHQPQPHQQPSDQPSYNYQMAPPPTNGHQSHYASDPRNSGTSASSYASYAFGSGPPPHAYPLTNAHPQSSIQPPGESYAQDTLSSQTDYRPSYGASGRQTQTLPASEDSFAYRHDPTRRLH